MLNWQGYRNVTANEKKAINTALEELNFSGKTTEEIQELINNDVIVLSDCRSGKTCIWYLDGDGFDCAVYVDNCMSKNNNVFICVLRLFECASV